jgi:DNA repair exonuclease SbcCD nuclease subunit
MRILHVADIHITLHKKKIPYEWQTNRFKMLFDKLLELEKDCDVTVLAGDIFDRKPEPDEICLFLSYANSVTKPTLGIPGNHEASTKGNTFLEHFEADHAINNANFILKTKNTRIEIQGQGFQLFPYGEMQVGNIPEYVVGDILVAHIRGEVPPHITAEFDFDKIAKWPLTLIGDLHFRHKYKDYPIYYSGSPINTTFDREENREYGVNIITIDPNNSSDYTVDFVDLKLPKLIRKTVDVDTELKSDPYHHVVYEVTGSIDKLSKIKNHELLDKKIAEKPSENSALNLVDKTLVEELELYLDYIKVDNKDKVLKLFNKLGIK